MKSKPFVRARAALVASLCAAALSPTTHADSAKVDNALHEQALEILRKSVGFRTVAGAGQVPAYGEYLKGVLVAAGFAPEDIRIEPVGTTALLIARYRGTDSTKKPIVINGHMDVVEARPQDWERDPFVAVVENGYVFGRGSVDNKFDVSMVTATLAHLKRSGWKPRRDVVLALSGDEETEMASTRKLARELKDAELVLNDDSGGGLLSEDGKPIIYGIQAAEKVYADFTLTVTDAGGHSSRPGKANAIYQLARALERIERYEFPAMQNEITRAYFQASAATAAPPIADAMRRFVADPKDAQAIATLSADREYIGQVRTTCVATEIQGGHAPNALPQRATANVNCRIFPGTSVASVQQTLTGVINDPGVQISVQPGSVEGDPSPLRPDVMAAVTKAVHASYPNVAIVPNMSAGATDSMHFRALGIPSYGVSGLFMKPTDDFTHGLNERVPVAAIDVALTHWDTLLRALAR
ncbi:MAG TPA: M20/M25/M40 family metallo-hydrolase [Steroidobacteraceae bacterium]|nr:M20/M25/M40 family metallo-hydrolase [Steroidobacteraceae bacterium]